LIITIIIFIMVIGKTALFGAIVFLRRLRQGAFGFHLFVFHNNIFLQSQVVSLASNPQPGGPGLCIYVPQGQGGPIMPPGTGFLFVAFCDSQGYSGGTLTGLHTG
jgi:hypothetical protein